VYQSVYHTVEVAPRFSMRCGQKRAARTRGKRKTEPSRTRRPPRQDWGLLPGRGSCHGNPTTPESFISSLRVSRTLVRALLHRAAAAAVAAAAAAAVAAAHRDMDAARRVRLIFPFLLSSPLSSVSLSAMVLKPISSRSSERLTECRCSPERGCQIDLVLECV